MGQRDNISLTGTLGSGKSSVCKILEQNGFSTISNGSIFREIAAEKKLTVVELNKLAETDKSIDKMLDDRSIKMGNERVKTVFDSRMGWHFIPESFKVFMFANMDEAGRRVYNDNRVSEKYSSKEEAKRDLIKRQLMEKSRFSSLYGVDYLRLSNYDLVIETTNAKPEEIAAEILKGYENKQNGIEKKEILLNPTSIYPMSKKDLSEEDLSGETSQVYLDKNNFYLTKGMNNLLNAIKNKESFISVKITGDDVEFPNEEIIKDFENSLDFKYIKYPQDNDVAIFER